MTIPTMVVEFQDRGQQLDRDRERLLGEAYRIYHKVMPASFHDRLVVLDLLHDLGLAELDAKRAKWSEDAA